jgi:surface carbohydrate biosynthesis protein
MIIYIPLEISARELPGYLLLAVVAASRGHQVFITSGVDLWLYKRLNLLNKGCYLLKNMNIPSPSERVYKGFLEDGFDLYCQEQEPSILWNDFEKYLDASNITKNQTLPFKGVFCWGERDTLEFKKLFKAKEEIFTNTGSLRAEVWQDPSLILKNKNFKKSHRPYILVVTNFGHFMGNKHWTNMSLVKRNLEQFESHEQEKVFIQSVQEQVSIACNLILAVKHIANSWPEYDLVIRPHPTESPEYYDNIFSHYKNIRVIGNSDSITPWISDASAVIQNGCTSAIESVIQKTPLISYGPDRVFSSQNIPNMLGIRVKSIEKINDSLKCIFNDKCYESFQVKSESIIQPVISIKKDNSALTIVKIMESNSSDLRFIKIKYRNLLGVRFAKSIKNNIDVVRKIFGVKGLDISQPNIDILTVRREMELMSKMLELPVPKLTHVSKSCLLVG